MGTLLAFTYRANLLCMIVTIEYENPIDSIQEAIEREGKMIFIKGLVHSW